MSVPTNPTVLVSSSNMDTLKNFKTNVLTMAVSGTLAAGANGTYTATGTFSRENAFVKTYFNQSNIAVGTIADYTINDYVPTPPYQDMFLPCSVAGSPAVVELNLNLLTTFTTSTITLTASTQNPYAGTLTWTGTTITFRTVSFLQAADLV